MKNKEVTVTGCLKTVACTLVLFAGTTASICGLLGNSNEQREKANKDFANRPAAANKENPNAGEIHYAPEGFAYQIEARKRYKDWRESVDTMAAEGF